MMPSCLTRSRDCTNLLKLPLEAQQLAGGPDRLRVDIRHFRIDGVEQQPQLLGQGRRPSLLARPGLVFVVLVLAFGGGGFAIIRPRWISSSSSRVVASGPGGRSSGQGTRT